MSLKTISPQDPKDKTPGSFDFKCKIHDKFTVDVDYDDICRHCPVKDCLTVSVKPELQMIPLLWHPCEKCNREYPTHKQGVCILHNEEAKNELEDIIKEKRGDN